MAKVRFFYALATVTGLISFLHQPATKFGLLSFTLASVTFYLLMRAVYVGIPAKRYNLQHIALQAESKEIVFKPTATGWRVALVTWQYKRTPETEFTYTGKNGNGIEWQKNEVGIHREKTGKKVHTIPDVFTDGQASRLLKRLVKVEQSGGNIFNFITLMQQADFIKLPLLKRLLYHLTPSPTLSGGGEEAPESQPVTMVCFKCLMFLPDLPDVFTYGMFIYHIGKYVLNFIYRQGIKDNKGLNSEEVISLTSRMLAAEKEGNTKEADRLNRQILTHK